MRSLRGWARVGLSVASVVAFGCGSDTPVDPCSGGKCVDASPDSGVDANPPPIDASVPDAVDAGTDASVTQKTLVTLSAGNLHTCAITSAKGVRCWGANNVGQLGNGGTSPQTGAVDVLGIGGNDPGAISLALGADGSCALLTNGSVKCWGDGGGGRLGNGQTSPSATPVTVTGITTAKALVQHWSHVCALLADTSVMCWGPNGGRLANGLVPDSSVPVAVPASTGTVALAVGWGHTCLVGATGGVRCAGTYNNWGQIGDGSNATRLSLVEVLGGVESPLGGIASIGMASYTTCAITLAGKLRCWGREGEISRRERHAGSLRRSGR